MDRFERIVAIHKLLTANRMGVTNERLMEEACCSSATLKRDLKFLRDALGAPLVLEGDPVRRWRYAPAATPPPLRAARARDTQSRLVAGAVADQSRGHPAQPARPMIGPER